MKLAGLTLILLFLAAFAGRTATAARLAQTGLPATDIVLAIDQSGSMADSDPQNLRIDAARRLVDTVAAYSDSQTTRIGAVTFGAPAYPPGPQLFFPLTPATQAGLRDRFQPQVLPGTDFISALCLAWTAVALQQPAPGAGCPDNPAYAAALQAPAAANLQSRVVVLVTDGFPAPQGQDLTFSPGNTPGTCPASSSGPAYMCNLTNTWQALTKAVSARLYVVGIDQTNQWFPLAEPYWRTLTGCQGETACAGAVRRSADPASLANDILNAGTGDLINLCTKGGAASQCDLPASLSQAQFLIEGLNDTDAVRVFNPGGVPLSDTNATVTRSAGVQRWQIKAPPSGVWRVESSNANANLSVSEILVRQQFTLRPDPPSPSAGTRVALDVTPDGPLQVDQPSLLSAPLQLRTQLNGGTEAKQPVKLVSVGPNTFRINDAITSGAAGQWLVTLVLPVGQQDLTLGSTSFQIGGGAASPSPSPQAQAPSPSPAPACTVAFAPIGPVIDRYQPAFVLSYPLRFHSGRTISANLRGPQCNNQGAASRLRLTVLPSAQDSGCPTGSSCIWEDAGGTGATVRGTLTGRLLGASSLHRDLQSQSAGVWSERGSDDVEVTTPRWVDVENETYVGYWSPLLLLLLLFAGFSFASTFQERRLSDSRYQKPLPLRSLGVYDESRGRARPLVQAGVLVWRSFHGSDGDGLLSLKYLIVGPLVVRRMETPSGRSSSSKSLTFTQQLDQWWRQARPMLLGDERLVTQAKLVAMPRAAYA